MRVTNTMITNNSKTYINGNKVSVNKYNTQMSTQKKIQAPSEDPVVAIRALRLRDTLSQIDQYYEKNIPDALSWLEITETSMLNMKDIINDVYKQCTYGASDQLGSDERDAILKELEQLQGQIYDECNSDYAGRTLFTGYKTNENFTFGEKDGLNTKYDIKETFGSSDVEELTYITNVQDVQYGTLTDVDKVKTPEGLSVSRIRLTYSDVDVPATDGTTKKYYDSNGNELYEGKQYTDPVLHYTDSNGVGKNLILTTKSIKELNSLGVSSDLAYQPAANEAFFIPETGEIILGSDVASTLRTSTDISVDYSKTGFEKGDVRPEHYFDCKKTEYDSNKNQIGKSIDYKKQDNTIEYSISFNQKIQVNTEASDVFASDMGRDVTEMIAALKASISADDKVATIKKMQESSEFTSDADKEKLSKMLEAAKKEADLAEDKVQSLFSSGMTLYQGYLSDVSLAITDSGSRYSRVEMTQTRMSSQQSTFEELKASNEDRDISDIIIDYTSAQTAYQASLQSTSKAMKTSLLDYI